MLSGQRCGLGGQLCGTLNLTLTNLEKHEFHFQPDSNMQNVGSLTRGQFDGERFHVIIQFSFRFISV